MEDEEEISTPFWAQSSSHRRRSSSVFLNSGLLLFTLCIAFSILFYLLSPTLKPNLFKKIWDSLNVTLVLLALIFGFLSRNINYDDRNSDTNGNEIGNEVVKSSGSTPRGWFECSDRTVVGLRRSYSSYPNLREVGDGGERWQFYDDMSLTRAGSPRVRRVVNGGDKWQFYDDMSLTRAASPRVRHVVNGGDRWRLYESDEASVVPPVRSVSRTGERWRFDDGVAIATRTEEALKVSSVRPVVDTGTVRVGEGASEAKNSDDSDSESSLNRSGRFVVGECADREAINDTRHSVLAEKERIIDENLSKMPVVRRTIVDPSEQSSSSEPLDGKRYESLSRKRGGNGTKHFIDSFRKKKKKQRQKSVDSLDTLPRNFFSSKKNKKTISVPPPPPPPPPQFFSAQAQRSAPAVALTAATSRRSLSPVQSGGSGESSLDQIPLPPPFFMEQKAQKSAPAAAASRYLLPVQNGDGGESPLRQIPPPPPLPPFKMASWKFVVKGDYVRIGSMGSSSDEADFSPKSSESGGTPTERDDKERGREGGMFCPSPDVNSKADMFIAKFRAGLKLQKMNSMNLKQGLGLSNLGPTTKT